MEFPGTGNTSHGEPTRRAPADHGQPRYWSRHARRLLPFDLGALLAARELHEVKQARHVLRHHPPGPPVLSQVKLIADPWTSGPTAGIAKLPVRLGHGSAASATAVRALWRGDAVSWRDRDAPLGLEYPLFARTRALPTPASTSVACHDGFHAGATSSATRRSTTKANVENKPRRHQRQRDPNWASKGTDRVGSDPRIRPRIIRNFRATVRRAWRSHYHGRHEMGARSSATTKPTAMPTTPSGSTGRLTTSAPLLDSRAACSRSAAEHTAFGRRHFFSAGTRSAPEGRLMVRPDGTEMTPDDWNDGCNQAVFSGSCSRGCVGSSTSASRRPARLPLDPPERRPRSRRSRCPRTAPVAWEGAAQHRARRRAPSEAARR